MVLKVKNICGPYSLYSNRNYRNVCVVRVREMFGPLFYPWLHGLAIWGELWLTETGLSHPLRGEICNVAQSLPRDQKRISYFKGVESYFVCWMIDGDSSLVTCGEATPITMWPTKFITFTVFLWGVSPGWQNKTRRSVSRDAASRSEACRTQFHGSDFWRQQTNSDRHYSIIQVLARLTALKTSVMLKWKAHSMIPSFWEKLDNQLPEML